MERAMKTKTWPWFFLFLTIPLPWIAGPTLFMLPVWPVWIAAGMLAIAGIVFPTSRVRILRFVLAANAVLVTYLVAYLMHFPFFPSFPRYLVWMGLAALFIVAIRRPRPALVLLAVNAFTFVAAYSALSWKLLNNPWMKTEVLRSEAVTEVPVFGQEKPSDGMRHGDLRFAMQRPDDDPRLLIGLRRGPAEGAFWFDERDGSWTRLPVRGAGDNALMVPAWDLWVVPDYAGDAIVTGRLSSDSDVRRYESEAFVRPRVVALDERRSRVLTIDEANELWSVELGSGLVQHILTIPNYSDWVSWDPVRDQIVVTWSREAWLVDAERRYVRARIPLVPCQTAANYIDVPGRRLFRTGVQAGRFEEIDLDAGVLRRSVSIGFGSYYMDYDRSRDLLAVTNYAHGFVKFLRGSDLMELGREFVGRRTRDVSLRADRGSVTLTSSAGVFRVSIPESTSAVVALR